MMQDLCLTCGERLLRTETNCLTAIHLKKTLLCMQQLNHFLLLKVKKYLQQLLSEKMCLISCLQRMVRMSSGVVFFLQDAPSL